MYFNFFLIDSTSNGLSPYILDILAIISILFGIFIIISKNPVISVLFLIGLFIAIAVYLVSIGLHFLGLAYLLVYVGAVSILFLFILMLINIRISELLSDTSNSIPLATLITIIFVYPINRILPYSIDNIINSTKEIINFATSQNWDGTLTDASHITSIGNIMYTNYSIWLFITSIILLLAMVGAIVITINQSNTNIPKQQLLEANIYSIITSITSQIKIIVLGISYLKNNNLLKKNFITEIDIFMILGIILLLDFYLEVLPAEVVTLSAFVLLLNLTIFLLPNKMISEFLIKIQYIIYIFQNPTSILIEYLFYTVTYFNLFNILKTLNNNKKLYLIFFLGSICYFISQTFFIFFIIIILGFSFIYIGSLFLDISAQTNDPYLGCFYFIVSTIFILIGIWTISSVIHIFGIFLIKILREFRIFINNFTSINRGGGNTSGNNPGNNQNPNPNPNRPDNNLSNGSNPNGNNNNSNNDSNSNGNNNNGHNNLNPRRNSEDLTSDNPVNNDWNPDAYESTLNNSVGVPENQLPGIPEWYPNDSENYNTNPNMTNTNNSEPNLNTDTTSRSPMIPFYRESSLERIRRQNNRDQDRARRAAETPAERLTRLTNRSTQSRINRLRRRHIIP